MRITALLVLSCLLAAPSSAADSTIADQASSAYQLFAGGTSEAGFLSAQYGDKIFNNVGGNWVRLNGPDPKTGIETYGVAVQKFCATQAALTLSSPNSYTLTLRTNLKAGNFTQDYSLIAGATFGEHTDPETYLGALGLGPDKVGGAVDQQRALLLSLANGLVQIYRPSADIIVMTRDRGYPIVLARCPAAAPTATGDAAGGGPPSSAAD